MGLSRNLKILLFFNRLRRYQTGSSHPDSSPAACPVSWFTTCSCLNYRPPVSQRTIWLRCLLWSWPTPVCAGVAPLAKPHCFSNSPPTPLPSMHTHMHTLRWSSAFFLLPRLTQKGVEPSLPTPLSLATGTAQNKRSLATPQLTPPTLHRCPAPPKCFDAKVICC